MSTHNDPSAGRADGRQSADDVRWHEEFRWVPIGLLALAFVMWGVAVALR